MTVRDLHLELLKKANIYKAYLAGKLAAEMVKGLEKSVIACVKHFIGNEQETNRMPDPIGITQSVSSNIDDKTMHELYLWPFQDAIRAGASSIMCAYNKVSTFKKADAQTSAFVRQSHWRWRSRSLAK
jgi:beta-glucosidase-like glycosyl hydrolase